MKTVVSILVVSVVALLIYIATSIVGNYKYDKEIQSYWYLADKASTITKKIEGIDKYVAALEKSNLQGKYNAIFLTTPDNSFDENFAALKSLQTRLHDIEKMDVKSFEYQTAMQQLTGQEMGEARNMINVFESIWWKEHHFMLWNWICAVGVIFFMLIAVFCFVWIMEEI